MLPLSDGTQLKCIWSEAQGILNNRKWQQEADIMHVASVWLHDALGRHILKLHVMTAYNHLQMLVASDGSPIVQLAYDERQQCSTEQLQYMVAGDERLSSTTTFIVFCRRLQPHAPFADVAAVVSYPDGGVLHSHPITAVTPGTMAAVGA
ncbi:hypothetical protein BV20DRAFT_715923 [Pilatotrama ljubarskyi]|nr:hypothetical protein BV20DRAFT_715923 [Pilatotrama ljubarskyi]